MKRMQAVILGITFCLVSLTGLAQVQEISYLNKYGNRKVTNAEAHFYVVMVKNTDGSGTRTRYLVSDSSKVSLYTYSNVDGGKWKLGIKDGPSYQWYSNGKLSEQANYKGDKLQGLTKMWFENGQLSNEQYYAEGELQDTLKGYYEDGTVRRIEIYKNGKMKEGKVYAQDGTQFPFYEASVMPQFPGGEQKLMRYLGQNIRYPASAVQSGISGIVVVSFTVRENGVIDDIEVIKSLQEDMDAEAVRVIKAMPKWKPGLLEGKPIDVFYTVPISYNIR